MGKKEEIFELLNNFFDKIYLITLKRSTDRHQIIHKTLQGLNYKIFWGVDGNELDIVELQRDGLYHSNLTKLLRKRKGENPRDLTNAQIGCALSHVRVYQDILNNNYNKALIFEDDLIIDLNGLKSLKLSLNELPEDWELLYLGHFGANSNPSTLLKLQKTLLQLFTSYLYKFERLRILNPKTIDCWFARPFSENLNLAGTFFGNHAYGVSLEGANKILGFQTPIVQEADNATSELCNYEWINAFSLKKLVFFQNKDLKSTISDTVSTHKYY